MQNTNLLMYFLDGLDFYTMLIASNIINGFHILGDCAYLLLVLLMIPILYRDDGHLRPKQRYFS